MDEREGSRSVAQTSSSAGSTRIGSAWHPPNLKSFVRSLQVAGEAADPCSILAFEGGPPQLTPAWAAASGSTQYMNPVLATSRRLLFAAVFAVGLAAATSVIPPDARAQMHTAFIQYPVPPFESPQADLAYARVYQAGARFVKLTVNWRDVASSGRPATPEDPDDPAYMWQAIDAKVSGARDRGLEPILMVMHAPAWASTDANGWVKPDPIEFGRFAQAVATRYSGNYSVPGSEFSFGETTLPRVRHWQAWNEPNLAHYLSPQFEGTRLVAAERYRRMVNAFSKAVKSVAVSPSTQPNLVLAGGTGPFRRTRNSAPLRFMREFLCLRKNLTRKPNCPKVAFDIWGHHPYTSGGPTQEALGRGDVSLGDLPEMREVLRAAMNRGTIISNGKVRFWADEFSWDTKPPDPGGVPAKLHARWTAEALYRMSRAGISLVAWLQLMDNEWTGRCGNPYQSGLYTYAEDFQNAKAKRSLAAYRFPFVALREGKRIRIWGRTPTSTGGTVAIQRKTSKGWLRVGRLNANASGIFTTRYRRPWTSGHLRAKYGAAASLPFGLKPVKNRRFNTFGAMCG